jgi:hypothetical protein
MGAAAKTASGTSAQTGNSIADAARQHPNGTMSSPNPLSAGVVASDSDDGAGAGLAGCSVAYAATWTGSDISANAGCTIAKNPAVTVQRAKRSIMPSVLTKSSKTIWPEERRAAFCRPDVSCVTLWSGMKLINKNEGGARCSPSFGCVPEEESKVGPIPAQQAENEAGNSSHDRAPSAKATRPMPTRSSANIRQQPCPGFSGTRLARGGRS